MKPILLVLGYSAFIGLLASCTKPPADSSDPVKSDPKHYKVEFENNHIRVLRATIGPHEKTTMHSHPANVVIALTANNEKETHADGTSTEGTGTPRSVGSGPELTHAMENLSDSAMESIVIELKDPQ